MDNSVDKLLISLTRCKPIAILVAQRQRLSLFWHSSPYIVSAEMSY